MITVKLDGNFTTGTKELAQLGYTKANHSAITFISKDDRQMIVVENCQGDYTCETFVMTGKPNSNSKLLAVKLEEDFGYFNVTRGDTYLWKECITIEDSNNGHTKYLCRGAL